MKKLLPFLFAFIFSVTIKAQAPGLTFTNVTGAGSITCGFPSINVLAGVNNTTITPLTYSWAGPASLSGTNVIINTPGSYTVTAYNTANSFSVTQVYGVGVNTTIPTSTLSPTFQNITCASGPATFTGVANPTLNIVHSWQSPYSTGTANSNGPTSIYSASAPGTYTYCLTNLVNGCSTCKTLTVASSSGFPTFSVTSPQQFTLGCGTSSITSLIITNASTTPPGGPLSYTILPPYYVGPTYTVGPASNYAANSPGQYTVIVHDNTNACETKIPVSVVLNTVAPNISYSAPTKTLTCNTPSIVLTGGSISPGTSFSWSIPGPVVVPVNTLAVMTTTNVTNTVIATYTLSVTSSANMCSSTQTLTVYQNTSRPTVMITGQNFISCSTPSINLTNTSISNVPPVFSPTQPVAGLAWYGPPPQLSYSNTSTYIAYTPGTYSLIAIDLNNGCTSLATKTIASTGVYPQINPSSPFNINCPAPTATIYPTLTGTITGFTYSWSAPATASLSSYTSSITVTNLPGTYTITVTNPANGCATTSLISVAVCAGINQNIASTGNISVYPNPTNGLLNVEVIVTQQNLELEVYSAFGVLVKKQRIMEGKNTINLQNEAKGLYFIYLKDGEKAIKAAKIVKE